MADFQKDILLSIQTDASSAQADIDAVKQKLELINNVVTDKSIKSLKQELKDATNATQKLFQALKQAEQEAEQVAEAFGQTSRQYQEAKEKIDTLTTAYNSSTKAVAQLRNEVDEVNQHINGLNPDNKLAAVGTIAKAGALAVQGLAGAFTAIGVNSETAQEAIARLQGIMAFTDALNAIHDIKDGWKSLGVVIKNSTVLANLNATANKATAFSMKALGLAVDTTSFSFKALKAAIVSTGIGAVILGISTLLPLITNWISGTDDAEAAQERLNQALERQKDLLAGDLKIIDYDTKLKLARAKLAGASEAEISAIESEGAKARIKELSDNYERLKAIAHNGEKRKLEDQDKANKAYLDAFKEYGDAVDAEQLRQENKRADAAEKARQKAKDEAAKSAQERKQAREKDTQDLKSYLENVDAITKDAAKELARFNLDERKLQLKQNEQDYNDKLSKLKDEENLAVAAAERLGKNVGDVRKKYDDARISLLNVNNQRVFDINSKFDKQVQDFIVNQTETEFQLKRDSIIKEFDEMIKVAGDKAGELEALKQSKLLQLNTEENLRKNTVTTQTNLINTEVNSAPSDKDTPDVAKAKIEALQAAKLNAENAAFKRQKEQLKGQKEELEQLEAQHNANIVDINKEASKAKQDIDKAELEAKKQAVDTAVNLANQAADLLGKNTVAGKALAVAATVIDTYKSATSAYAGMVKAIPGPPGIAAGFAAAGISVAAGLANVKKILAVKVPAQGGTGGASPVATAPTVSTAPIIQAAQTSAIPSTIQDVRVTNTQDQVIRSFIVDRDLQTQQQKSEFLNNLKTI